MGSNGGMQATFRANSSSFSAIDFWIFEYREEGRRRCLNYRYDVKLCRDNAFGSLVADVLMSEHTQEAHFAAHVENVSNMARIQY